MKKSAVAAAALAGTLTLSGSAVLTGSAAFTGSATAAPQMQTKRLVLHNTAERGVGKLTFVGSDTVRARSSREIIGYDSFTGKVYPGKEKVVIQIAFALKGGIIVGRVTGRGEQITQFAGPILKGSGRYQGIKGDITVRLSQRHNHKLFATMHYHR